MHHPDLINHEMIEENDLILHGHTHLYRLEKKMNCIILASTNDYVTIWAQDH